MVPQNHIKPVARSAESASVVIALFWTILLRLACPNCIAPEQRYSTVLHTRIPPLSQGARESGLVAESARTASLITAQALFAAAMDSFPEPSDSPKHPSPTTTRARDPALSEPGAKRRKVRKGTRSCWECKRRKVRCNFVSEHDAVCIGCRQRGTKCVSQEFPEEASAPADRSRQMGDRIVRVEALVEQLVKSVASGSNKPATPDAGIPTPSSSTSELPQILSLCDESSPVWSSCFLALPPTGIILTIARRKHPRTQTVILLLPPPLT